MCITFNQTGCPVNFDAVLVHTHTGLCLAFGINHLQVRFLLFLHSHYGFCHVFHFCLQEYLISTSTACRLLWIARWQWTLRTMQLPFGRTSLMQCLAGAKEPPLPRFSPLPTSLRCVHLCFGHHTDCGSVLRGAAVAIRIRRGWGL